VRRTSRFSFSSREELKEKSAFRVHWVLTQLSRHWINDKHGRLVHPDLFFDELYYLRSTCRKQVFLDIEQTQLFFSIKE